MANATKSILLVMMNGGVNGLSVHDVTHTNSLEPSDIVLIVGSSLFGW